MLSKLLSRSTPLSTNQRALFSLSTNQRAPFSLLTNQKAPFLVSANQRASFSISANQKEKSGNETGEDKMFKSVLISQSEDIFTNLALEDWLYRNGNFSKNRVLFLWKNNPCVVIGRHQNLWEEVDVSAAQKNEVSIARRNSGGGAVYHDAGNLNCTFFTERSAYNRRANLEIIQSAIRKLGISAEINSKEDILVNGSKISGTASKLGKNAYHHCTLLVDSDLKTLSHLLNPQTEGIKSNATKSRKSPVVNLSSLSPSLSLSSIIKIVGTSYLEWENEKYVNNGFSRVNPTEDWFPGLGDIYGNYRSWEWTAGRSPNFTLSKTINNPLCSIQIELSVSKGIIEKSTWSKINPPNEGLNAHQNEGQSSLGKEFKNDQNIDELCRDVSGFLGGCQGRNYTPDIISTLESLIEKKDKNNWTKLKKEDEIYEQSSHTMYAL